MECDFYTKEEQRAIAERKLVEDIKILKELRKISKAGERVVVDPTGAVLVSFSNYYVTEFFQIDGDEGKFVYSFKYDPFCEIPLSKEQVREIKEEKKRQIG